MKRKFKWWMTPIALVLSPIFIVLCFLFILIVMPIILVTTAAVNIYCYILNMEPPEWGDISGGHSWMS